MFWSLNKIGARPNIGLTYIFLKMFEQIFKYTTWSLSVGSVLGILILVVYYVVRRSQVGKHPTRVRNFGKEVSFSGGPWEDIFKFISDVEDLTGWISDEGRVEFAASRLRGNAGQWFRFRKFQSEAINWGSLREQLLRQYGRIYNRADLADELFSKKFSIGEDFERFVWEFRNLYLL